MQVNISISLFTHVITLRFFFVFFKVSISSVEWMTVSQKQSESRFQRWHLFVYQPWNAFMAKKKAGINCYQYCVSGATIKPDALPTVDVLMVCNSKCGASLCPPLVPLLLSSTSPFLPPSLHASPTMGSTLLCDGARCQLVSSTCRRGSLVQASAGCEIGHLTFVHELCMAPVGPNTCART